MSENIKKGTTKYFDADGKEVDEKTYQRAQGAGRKAQGKKLKTKALDSPDKPENDDIEDNTSPDGGETIEE